jgi:hypothetical protein
VPDLRLYLMLAPEDGGAGAGVKPIGSFLE